MGVSAEHRAGALTFQELTIRQKQASRHSRPDFLVQPITLRKDRDFESNRILIRRIFRSIPLLFDD